MRANDKLMKVGRDAILQSRQPKVLSAREKAMRLKSMENKVSKVIAELDGRGRWVTTGHLKKRNYEFNERVETPLFMNNAGVLIEYLELAR